MDKAVSLGDSTFTVMLVATRIQTWLISLDNRDAVSSMMALGNAIRILLTDMAGKKGWQQSCYTPDVILMDTSIH